MGLGVAVGAFLKCLFNGDFSSDVKDLAMQRKTKGKAQKEVQKTVEKVEEKPIREEKTNEKAYHNGAIHILAQMQKEGRLIDFLNENLDNYNDEEIGGSVRTIHEGCKKAVWESLKMDKVVDQEEESTCRINKDYDAKSIKLTGRVSDNFPMKGNLIHPGWKVSEVKLTQKKGASTDILAPAEVEIE